MNELARSLMEEFADATGITGSAKPRRYLWTDAYAVCNFLTLALQTDDVRYLKLARELVYQVHHVLGRHREDDLRHGWISGLLEDDGEEHPTIGGLRIGKQSNERGVDEPSNSRLEWDQDGQYFHYLTKWTHVLYLMSQATGEKCYLSWAAELAITAHHAFTYGPNHIGPKRMVWKMSIDLRRPLVFSMGHHDPLDGLVNALELRSNRELDADIASKLAEAITDYSKMCSQVRWRTDDPLGIGGLLDIAARIAQLIDEHGLQLRQLLYQLMVEIELSLFMFQRSSLVYQPTEHRLAFRELGLSIGLHSLERIKALVANDAELTVVNHRMLRYRPLAEQIEAFWSYPPHQQSKTWTDHLDINSVMLATSLTAVDSFEPRSLAALETLEFPKLL